MKFVGIDPSINACGLAIVYGSGIQLCETIRTPAHFDLISKCKWIMDKIRRRFDKHMDGVPYLVGIEFPTFQNSQRGRAAAVQGNTLKLAFVCGFLAPLFPTISVRLLTPTEWKGTVSKEITAQRLCQHPIYGSQLQRLQLDHNAIDALGIAAYLADYAYGKLKTKSRPTSVPITQLG